MTESQIKFAAREVEEYIRDLVKPWTEFYGHADAIARIIRKAAK